jgi:hypothetical protein
MPDPKSPCELFFEKIRLLSSDKGGLLDNPLHRGIQLGAQGRMLGGQVGERHGRVGGGYFDVWIFLAGLPA